MNLLPRTTDDPGARRRLIVAAEVALVVLLVIVNIALWNRSSAPPADAGDVRAAGTTSSRAAGGASTSPRSSTPSTSRTTTSPTLSPSTSSVTSSPTPPPSPPSTTSPPVAPAQPTAGDRERAVSDVLGRARRVVIAVDTSQGMGGALPQVRSAVADLVRQAPDGTTVGVLTFSAAGSLIASPPAPVTAERRDALVRDIESLQPAAAPGRPLYDAMVMGYQHAVSAAPVGERPLLVVVTNGPRQGGADLQTFVTFITAAKAQNPATAYPLIVAVGAGPDLSALRTAAAQGAGRVVRAAGPAQVRDALFASLAESPIPSFIGETS